jgi:uncharacterized protein YbjT (DUF2867 family)
VRALGRNAKSLEPLAAAGAEVMTGDASDAAYLAAAFRGADAVYTLIPPDAKAPDFRAYQDRIGEAIVRAVRESGVRAVVFLSSLGAEHASGTGPIAGLHAQEERLRTLAGVNVLSLRPGYFFENTFATLGLIKHQGINGGAIAPDVPISMIATRDIGERAAQALRARDWNGVVVRELLGPRDLTMNEVTKILGARIGKPDLKYVQFGADDFINALVQMGLSRSVSGLYAEMCRAINEGKVKTLEGRRPGNTTPTRFEDFVEILVRAYGSA